jgi:hypothetical protein
MRSSASKKSHNAPLDLRNIKGKKTLKLPIIPPTWAIIVLAFVAVSFVCGMIYLAMHNQSQIGKVGMEEAVARVEKLMLLPTGETPTYGTVADTAKLKDQVFFKTAANGDEILIYQKARLTVLYRPSINKIINVGPLVVGSNGSPYVTSKFAIKNGTGNQALADQLATKLRQLYPNATIISSQAASRAYQTSITIDLTKKNQPLDEQVADSLGIKAGQSPLGESIPDGDFLIIIGADYH